MRDPYLDDYPSVLTEAHREHARSGPFGLFGFSWCWPWMWEER